MSIDIYTSRYVCSIIFFSLSLSLWVFAVIVLDHRAFFCFSRLSWTFCFSSPFFFSSDLTEDFCFCYMCKGISVSLCQCIEIYTYTYREREREGERHAWP
ncbi:hypothetical protein CSUI_006148 [Cystoisospora suis]|uniref:Transmembrane protein n=1 Tax=Cystoisospora suis TaxID=483139 RepID=A0A2C6K260_9APIC|nr:hypothetical protein CSUI_006148 [Cystoisospora suis]